MIDISIKNLIKSFEIGNNILDGFSLEVQSGDRVGILGKNGCGKTTMFKILVGDLGYDEGTVSVANGKRMGLMSQIPVYPVHYTVDDVLKEAHRPLFEMAEKIENLTEQMASDSSDSIMKEYDRLSTLFESRGGYTMEAERSKVANGLEIPKEMRNRAFELLSGGEKTRVNLARLILEDTDILLLDEPTNHLDLRAVEWLEEYLRKFHGTVLVISHDRYFLDRVVKRCVEISSGKDENYSGNYSFFVEERLRRFEEQMKKYEKEQKELKRLDEAARRLYQWGTGNETLMKKSLAIRSRMARMSKTERPKTEKKLRVKFSNRDFHGDELLVLEKLKKSFGERVLFSDLELLVKGGERIGIIGDNGTGKTTLLKMIVGEQFPDSGSIYKGPTTKAAYLPQTIKFESDIRNLYDTMLYSDKCSPQQARDRLGAFGFSGDDVFKPVGALSGGEKSRLRLCMLMRDEINLLFLDEPTNHLDISSREWIEESLEEYSEALIFVSHDRYFINKFANRIWAFENGEVLDFDGTFDEYKEFIAKRQAFEIATKIPEKKAEKPPKPKSGGSIEKQIAKLEREIEKAESSVSELEKELEIHASDYEKLLELYDKKSVADENLNALYEKWEELSQ